jgi:hypothetical protein
MGKIIYFNILVDFAQLVRAHGLYPRLSKDCIKYSPSIAVAYNHIINSGSQDRQMAFLDNIGDTSGLPLFETIRLRVENSSRAVGITKQVKPLIAKSNIVACNSISGSVLPWFYMNWLVWLYFGDMVGMKDTPILKGGNYVGASTANKRFPFDNLFMRLNKTDTPGSTDPKVTTMTELRLVNGDEKVRIASHIALVLFDIVNTKVLQSQQTADLTKLVLDQLAVDNEGEDSSTLLDILKPIELKDGEDGEDEGDDVVTVAKTNATSRKTPPRKAKGHTSGEDAAEDLARAVESVVEAAQSILAPANKLSPPDQDETETKSIQEVTLTPPKDAAAVPSKPRLTPQQKFTAVRVAYHPLREFLDKNLQPDVKDKAIDLVKTLVGEVVDETFGKGSYHLLETLDGEMPVETDEGKSDSGRGLPKELFCTQAQSGPETALGGGTPDGTGDDKQGGNDGLELVDTDAEEAEGGGHNSEGEDEKGDKHEETTGTTGNTTGCKEGEGSKVDANGSDDDAKDKAILKAGEESYKTCF